ncbi:MAG: L-seryl-tRNA(Sec) selenium transferase [Phycisphaerales bacterium]|nr:L-seryl-tRNA(Sec) selenium transferase [Phycisphaerales bacterium]
MADSNAALLRSLPAVGEFLSSLAGRELCKAFGEGVIKRELRQTLDDLRHDIRTGKMTEPWPLDRLTSEVTLRARRLTQPQARQAINATGILLHTGLGRAPMCDAAIEAIRVAAGYTPLQASLESGDRSLREARVEQLLQELIGCEAATVVNNNAAATMLILNTLAAGKEVIISRGQLIEIGGSFRMTDVMAQSNAILREVGTTNRTHLRDYQAAIGGGGQTGALIHVHTSNYRVRGFASTPSVDELVALGRKHELPVIDDLGSGAIVPLSPWGISDEPLVKDSLAAGSDVICFSGDKLICGPQAGIICGRKTIIERIRKNPYARMFRVCKLTLAGLEATLLEFINNTYRENIPFYRMLSRDITALDQEARTLAVALAKIDGLSAEVAADLAYVGSGSIPDEGLPTRVVRLRHGSIPAGELARGFRMGIPSVFGRLADRELVIDLRTLREGEVAQVAAAAIQVCSE